MLLSTALLSSTTKQAATALLLTAEQYRARLHITHSESRQKSRKPAEKAEDEKKKNVDCLPGRIIAFSPPFAPAGRHQLHPNLHFAWSPIHKTHFTFRGPRVESCISPPPRAPRSKAELLSFVRALWDKGVKAEHKEPAILLHLLEYEVYVGVLGRPEGF